MMIDPLQHLREYEEEDGSPVAVCDPGCGLVVIDCFGGWDIFFGDLREYHKNACPVCRALLGFDADGRPYRIRHSRIVAALEQAWAERDRYREALRDIARRGRNAGDNNIAFGVLQRCRRRAEAALAATEEPSP